ncbi:MAG: hypothetical protein MJ252_18570 [archaeon]|nr:hypothetical protein [archaeon]
MAKENFVIDTNIKKKKRPQIKKELVQYQVNEKDAFYFGSLNEEKDTKWNQFELNRKLFNYNSTYDENKYTTPLNVDLIPEEHKIRTQQIVNEIMNKTANQRETNIHILEDRGFANENEFDEEDKYSSVLRK